ncbi:similar to Saccharomyces cerevisiae YPL172C COX10 Heme A:farnesyltransferase [Maudiozyma barnettii]|uniref:Protoheme IX farnesyltransferase, mitochondrial n=1 Tax=Maudiozyma barnettii TaxID=61262 RepID=A0A8H2VCC4_9SACH|nr:protoheme IX farnesyltransferase [Kazachstania barnettii]CAB4252697.1 similar to Saccharomyces cerevisiae YPL172C COX10 Heme A:farnesyltransferase [Kazachstania barnettii]CAD1780487.1 similar to Saccharomyces cerevisiae YPL172C COX10 Heme A:farnesyltransferase [Kazachstania barnettii]
MLSIHMLCGSSTPILRHPICVRTTAHGLYVLRRGISTSIIRSNNAHVNTAPVEFQSNRSIRNMLSNKEKALEMAIRCTDDITDPEENSTTKTVAANVSLPFEVKPLDASARKLQRKKHKAAQPVTFKSIKKQVVDPYVQLTKPRLTILVMLSAICSYALSPNAASVSQLLSLTVGTTLCSGAANAINMGREPEFDRQMTRTQTRPVVTGLVTSKQAFEFASIIGSIGVSTLYIGVNPLVAALGAANIGLYAWTYTSLKRKHIINTWIGAIVGAIPPLMGWAAASSLTDPGAWCLASLLYAWQFPHFNALSHNIKNEYKNAGYVMTAWKNPKLNARVALRYSLLMFPLCIGLAYFGVTDPFYAIDSSIANAWLAYWAFKFYWQQRKNYTKAILENKELFNKGMHQSNIFARKTMLTSVMQLPAVLLLAIFHKKDRWKWLFNKDAKLKPV